MIRYGEKPFCLADRDIRWVEDTYNAMTEDEKIGQLFCPIIFSKDEKDLRVFTEEKHIGGVLFREGPAAEIQECHRILQKHSRIPLLTASNLETGGVGSAAEGTYFGRQMLAAATGRNERAYQLGKVSCSEGAAVGVNWALSPVVDLDRNFRNPIINVRSFGDDPERVISMSSAFMDAADEEGVAVCLKHFPGDGIDERDQHLLTSVNTLSCEEWDRTYGRIYSALIEKGALTVMAGHIAMPAYEEKYDGVPCTKIIPATLSKNLLTGLLRERLNFNGLITTDATPMTGFCAAMERRRAIPCAVESGCDIIMFNKDLDEDIRYMKDGIESGLLSRERLEEAVKRILAVKAALKLHDRQREGKLVPGPEALSVTGCMQHERWAEECADEGVTCVKDTQKLLPISPERNRRILLEMMGDFPSNERVCRVFTKLLEEKGFEVTKYLPEELGEGEIRFDTVEQFRSKYDMAIYIGNTETASNRTVARLSWHTLFGLGNNMPWFAREIPVMFISVGNPYHLLDVPMIRTYINGYCNSDHVIKAVIEKITGSSRFKGKSPVDPFCGRKDLGF